MSNNTKKNNNVKKANKEGMSTDTKRLIIVIALIASMLAIAVVIMACTGVFSGNNGDGADNSGDSSSSTGGSSSLGDLDAWIDEDGGIHLPPRDVEPDSITPGTPEN